MVSIVDSADIELVSAYTWHASMTRGDRHYAKTNLPNGGTMYLHRLILEMPDGVVDHISGNSLDNRKCNLRVVSVAENNLNRSAQSNSQSGYKGVSPKGSKWTATIKRGDVIVRLGTFDTPEEAARAYDDAAIDLHGEFAHLNYRR